eukprot:291898_1
MRRSLICLFTSYLVISSAEPGDSWPPHNCIDLDNDGFCGNGVIPRDCDDNDPNQRAIEMCGDGFDNNCDGIIDEPGCCMADADMDGSCDDSGNDCDPSDPWTRGPDSLPLEYCNAIYMYGFWYVFEDDDNGDQDCDGLNDMMEDRCCMQDNDNDGFCDVQFISREIFDGFFNYGDATDGEDCNGNDPNINPGATEICNDNIDNNCNNQIDEEHDAIEICDGIDNNCDGSIDNDISGLGTCGIGACKANKQCINGAIQCTPGTPTEEICNDGIDNDCDGLIDNDEDCTSPPSNAPSVSPTETPSLSPSITPTQPPSLLPSIAPSSTPTQAPSLLPSIAPSLTPSITPSLTPSSPPTFVPSVSPTTSPTNVPIHTPTNVPIDTPTNVPIHTPTNVPIHTPTNVPIDTPTNIQLAIDNKNKDSLSMSDSSDEKPMKDSLSMSDSNDMYENLNANVDGEELDETIYKFRMNVIYIEISPSGLFQLALLFTFVIATICMNVYCFH